MKRARRIAGKATYWIVLAPWFAITLPVALLAMFADWFSYTGDPWLAQNVIGPIGKRWGSAALKTGNVIAGYKGK